MIKALDAKLMAILTSDQAAQLRSMGGAPFHATSPEGPPPGGPGGGQGGGPGGPPPGGFGGQGGQGGPPPNGN
jgi:hypothetical protein